MPSPPPSYAQATGTHLTRNGISPAQRRSMEDESRPLPSGWVRSFDPESSHQFFVDTTKDPPRSIWHHPHDDEEYLATLSPDEQQNLARLHKSVSLKDIEAESSDDEEGRAGPSSSSAAAARKDRSSELPPRPADTAGRGGGASSSSDEVHGLHRFGRRLKDKVTSSTHQEREQRRDQRAREEQAAYERHIQTRQAFARAIQTGEPQYLGKDRSGRDVYIESPYGPQAPMGAQGFNPFARGPYQNQNVRFVRPQMPYGRPYGYGYGGGYGLPLAGGLLGGAMLGSLLF